MVLFMLTVCSLDIALGVSWWLTKTTFNIVYYGGQYIVYKYNSNKLIEAPPNNNSNNN